MQLSLLHWIMMDQIPVREHIHWIGSKDKKNCCPKLSALVEHFNWLSNWIVFEVVTQIRLEERVKLCERIIHILMKLVRSRNFFGAMALVGALRSAPVYRMKKTLSSIDESWRIKYDEVCQILPVTNQPTTYRRVVAEVPASSSVPYLGVLSKDLLFTHDGNTAFCGEDKALFNWNSKFAKIAEMIFTHREQMGGIYDVDADERLLSFLVSEIPQLSIDDAFSWSRRSEPKDSEVMIGELIQIERELTQEITEAGKKAENDAKEIERLKEELKEKDEIIGQLKAKLGES